MGEEEEEEEVNRSSESLTNSTGEKVNGEGEGEGGDSNVLTFLDSVDSYLILIESLSSTLRQGWLELASARHSMGASRINTALLDHKDHPAATSLEVNHHDADGSIPKPPQFTLCKWKSTGNAKSPSGEAKLEEDNVFKKKENTPESNGGESIGSPRMTDNSVQKARSRLLSMFGTLVSPKLRSSQLSFETALETLVELANMRSSMLAAYDQVRKEMTSSMS